MRPPGTRRHSSTARPLAAEADEIVWWVVFVGFAYAIALAYATYCRISGGYPDISLTWKGFKVACKSG